MNSDDLTIWSTELTVVQSTMYCARLWSTEYSMPINCKQASMSFGIAPIQQFATQNGSIMLSAIKS